MARFKDILQASPEKLVHLFYKVKPAPTPDFLVRIDWAATQLQLNHAQLVCALGFNVNVRDVSDVLVILGFSSFKPLTYRRNELYSTDAYAQLDIDNILDIYSAGVAAPEFMETFRECLPRRLAAIESHIGRGADPALEISYRMEVHTLYNSGIANREFAVKRLQDDLGQYRLVSEELAVIVDNHLVPPSNAFFMESLLPEEKRLLIDRGLVAPEMVRNRLANEQISPEERAVLEEYA